MGPSRPSPVTRHRPRVAPWLGIPSIDCREAHTRTTDRADVTAGLEGYDWLITSGPGSLSCGNAQTGRPDRPDTFLTIERIIGRACII